MGHHLFKIGTSVFPMHDGDVELVRHFLIVGAKDVGLPELALSVDRWEWQGPGVWIHIDMAPLARHPIVFDAAVRSVERLGDVVDVPYLNTQLRRFGMEWRVAQKVSRIVERLRGLRAHVQRGGA